MRHEMSVQSRAATEVRAVFIGAGLEATDPEPIDPEHPLVGMENVLITSQSRRSASGAAGSCARASPTP